MRMLLICTAVACLLTAAPTALGHSAPPCNDSGDPGNSDYAQHHIRALALQGDLGGVDHDGDGIAHAPGVHQGYSLCDPAANA